MLSGPAPLTSIQSLTTLIFASYAGCGIFAVPMNCSICSLITKQYHFANSKNTRRYEGASYSGLRRFKNTFIGTKAQLDSDAQLALIIKPSRVRTLAILLHLLFSTRLYFLSSHPDLSSRIDLHDSSIPHRSDIGKAMDGRAILKPRQRCHVGSPIMPNPGSRISTKSINGFQGWHPKGISFMKAHYCIRVLLT